MAIKSIYKQNTLDKINQNKNNKPIRLLKTNNFNVCINPKISIIIPCYNEVNTINQVLDSIFKLELPNYEIIVVDDHSNDGTLNLLVNREDIRIIAHSYNKGYGKSILDGINIANGDILITIDGDLQHNPADIPELCKPLIKKEADIVIGSRYLGNYYYSIPFTNLFGEIFVEKMIQILFGVCIKNNQGGFRAFNRKTKKMFLKTKFHRMAFTTELILLSSYFGFKVVERPIELNGRCFGKSKVKKFFLFLNILYGFGYYIIKNIQQNSQKKIH